jgi:1-acyl-sn-glycerol-3-phosphate acyltransferase
MTTSTAASPRARRALLRRPVFVLRCAAALMLMTIGSLVMLLVAALTLFRARRLYAEVFARALGRATLRLWGIRVLLQGALPSAQPPSIYIANHTSTIDLFVLIALGLPNTRFFLSGYLRKVLPLGLIGCLLGVFWTVPQDQPERRTRIFQRAARILRRSGESVFLSPEGQRVTTGRIGHFNKGAFHLATDLKRQIVPLYIRIPPEIDPGKGFDARPGVVQVHVHPPIETRAWHINELERHRDAVQVLYVRWHQQLRPLQEGA